MHLVIGLGETGGPLYEVLCDKLGESKVFSIDLGKKIFNLAPGYPIDFMHICIPYSDRFVEIVKDYRKNTVQPKHTIIHSTVPIGTTRKIEGAVHSPILGRHNRMKEDLLAYPKWIGGWNSVDIQDELSKIFPETRKTMLPEQTEGMKLLCLAKYGVELAFAAYQKDVCDKLEIPWGMMVKWDAAYNETVGEDLQRPIFRELKLPIGGHCVIANTKILNEQHPNPMLEEVLKNG